MCRHSWGVHLLLQGRRQTLRKEITWELTYMTHSIWVNTYHEYQLDNITIAWDIDHFLLVLCLLAFHELVTIWLGPFPWIGNDLTWSFSEWWNAYVSGCWLQGSGLKPKPMPGATAGPRRRQFQSHVTYKKVSNCDNFAHMDLSGNHMKSTWDGKKWSIIWVSKGDLKMQVLQGLRGVGIVSWLMPHSLANCNKSKNKILNNIWYTCFGPAPLVQTILTIWFLQGDSCNISLEIASPLPTEAAHTATSGSVTGVTEVTGVNEFNVDVSTFAPTVPEASAPKWTFSTFLAVLVEYLGFVLCITMLLLLPCFTVNRSTKDTTTPMPSRFIKVWNLQNTISQAILREL